MSGYQSQQPDQEPGSWGEILAMVRVVFVELARPLLAIVGTLALVISTLILFFTNPPYALLPLAILGGLTWYLVRRDRQSARNAEDALDPPRR